MARHTPTVNAPPPQLSGSQSSDGVHAAFVVMSSSNQKFLDPSEVGPRPSWRLQRVIQPVYGLSIFRVQDESLMWLVSASYSRTINRIQRIFLPYLS